jgi:hypothetical protein
MSNIAIQPIRVYKLIENKQKTEEQKEFAKMLQSFNITLPQIENWKNKYDFQLESMKTQYRLGQNQFYKSNFVTVQDYPIGSTTKDQLIKDYVNTFYDLVDINDDDLNYDFTYKLYYKEHYLRKFLEAKQIDENASFYQVNFGNVGDILINRVKECIGCSTITENQLMSIVCNLYNAISQQKEDNSYYFDEHKVLQSDFVLSDHITEIEKLAKLANISPELLITFIEIKRERFDYCKSNYQPKTKIK